MNDSNEQDISSANTFHNVYSNGTGGYSIIQPLIMNWKPKEDITVYELAMCLPYLLRINTIMPYEVDKSLEHFRHFEIINHNI